MTTITDNMRLDVPEDGDAGSEYSEKVRDSFGRIDVHSHTDEYGVRIPVEGIDIQGPLEFNNQAATEVGYVEFQDQTTTLSGAVYANRLYNADGTLVWNDDDGNPNIVGSSSGGGGSSGTFLQGGSGAVIRTTNEKVGETVSILDFLDGSDVRGAIIAAHDYLATKNGGTLLFPSRSTSYDIDNTGLGPIELTVDGVWWEGQGAFGSIIRNTSTDGTAMLLLDGGSNALQRCGWRNLKIDSISTAGQIWQPGENGLSFCRWENLWVIQRNVNAAIMKATFTDTGGMFENQWVGGVYEVGTSSTRYAVHAFDFRANANLVTLNKWQDMRFHCHDNLDYLFRIECTSGASGASCRQNEWRGLNVEVCAGGFAYIAGCSQHIFSDIVWYDNNDAVDGTVRDLIHEDLGSGGKICEGTLYHKVASDGGYLTGFAGTTVSVTSITRSGTTATVNATAHGLTTGMVAYIQGAGESQYNGRFVITRINNNSFTIEVSGSPATPATGTITTASGTMDIRLGPSGQMAMFIHCAGLGTAAPIQIDLNNRGATVIGDNASRAELYRVAETTTTILGMGTGAHVSTNTVFCNAIEERGAGDGITVSGVLTAQDGFIAEEGVTFGAGGSKITEILKVVEVIDPDPIPAWATHNIYVTLAGIDNADRVLVSPASLPEEGLMWSAMPTSSGSVILRLANVTGSTINPVSRNWAFTAFRH